MIFLIFISMISSISYKTIIYTSILVLTLDNEGEDLLSFILSQHNLPSKQHLCCLNVNKSHNMTFTYPRVKSNNFIGRGNQFRCALVCCNLLVNKTSPYKYYSKHTIYIETITKAHDFPHIYININDLINLI